MRAKERARKATKAEVRMAEDDMSNTSESLSSDEEQILDEIR